MPVLQVVINEIDHQRLEQEHATLVDAWPSLGNTGLAPTFAQWLGTRAAGEAGPDGLVAREPDLDDVRLFNAIERLVSILPQHGFNLAHTTPAGTDPERCALDLSQAIVADFQLPPQYGKRLQELFMHYLKTAREIADIAQIGITNRAYGALTEAHRKLTERTILATATLGTDKAIGRVEGATAILVSLDVMDRATAKKRTSAFKAEARALRKPGLLGRMFSDS
jgi:hypothetical protein